MLIGFIVGHSQTISLTEKATLPAILVQSSGLAVINRNNIWSHNDSSGNPELYNFDSTGTLLRTLKILNATNIDWEDLAKDTAGNFFIGDFGNNNNTRQNLKIYIIPSPSGIVGDSVIPQVINYSYPDQCTFPPPNSNKNFDSEALVAYHDSLYIFSKNWSDPYSGYTKRYKLPSTPGTFVAELVDSFYTGSGPPILYSITGASINADNSKLILLGYNKCWLFSNFTGSDFFSGTNQLFNFPSLTQKEAVTFISDDELYITDELISGIGKKLYDLKFLPLPTAVNDLDNSPLKLDVFPNPFMSRTTLSISAEKEGNCALQIYNQIGQRIFTKTLFSFSKAILDISLDESVFKGNIGLFVIEVIPENGKILRKKIVKF